MLYTGPRAHISHAQSGHEIGQARCINEGSEYLYRIGPTHDTSPLYLALLVCQSNTQSTTSPGCGIEGSDTAMSDE